MKSRTPVSWLLYGFGALVALVLAGRLLAMMFASFFSLLSLEERIDRSGPPSGTVQARSDLPQEAASAHAASSSNLIPGAARPLTEADLEGPAPGYLETPESRSNREP